MSDNLSQLKQHINRLLAKEKRPLYLELDFALRVVDAHGDGQHFGLPPLAEGVALDDALAILSSADHDSARPLGWAFVELPTGAICHIHALPQKSGWSVALLDAQAEHAARQQRQQAAHDLALLRDERERLIDELDKANRLKGEFIARMSHEFRTPLAAVIGYSDELRELRQNDKEVISHLSAVGRGAHYLLNLVENLLDHASIENNTLSIKPSGCDLHELSDEIELLLRPVARQKQLALAWWFDGNIPSRVWVDGTRLKQILINLVGNAIKFTRSGGVNVEFDWHDNRLDISVEDTGPGIPPADAQVIFQPFNQGGTDRHAKGAGLGLAISQTLIREMGGDIALKCGDSQGARFEFSVDAPAVRNSQGTDTRVLSGLDIVIADDDPDMRELLKLFLSAAGCRVHATHSGTEAMELAKRIKPRFVVLDINLDDGDGSAIAHRLRENGFRGRIVALSGNDSQEQGEQAFRQFDAFWRKPVSRWQLLDGLADLLGEGKASPR